jgi:tetratricopeptide (TPR) repeat protein
LSDFLATTLAFKVVAVAAMLTLLQGAYQARKRIVIMPFTDYTGDAALKSYVEGLASRLLNELAGIADLYRTIDEARPTPVKEGIDVTVRVEDVGQTLRGAVSADSKVSLGPFLQVPIGAILAVVGRMVQGPRLTGSLYKEGEKLLLIAAINGGGLAGNWRVSVDDLAEVEVRVGTETAAKMTVQLAYRVFAGLMHIGSRRWRAVKYYAEGLRAYRETLQTNREKTLQLCQAEKAFIQALAEDNKFAMCHYNLGIVYRGLKKGASAEVAFRLAVKADPNQFDAYYALARHYLDKQEYENVIRCCDQSIRLRPDEALAWDLKGFAQRKFQEQQIGRPLKAGENPEAWAKIIQGREIAAALAWQALCSSALKGRLDNQLKDIARICTRNLAVAHAMVRDRQSKTIFHQAIHLAPTDPELYFELGKTLHDAEDWRGAISAFEEALGIEERAVFWAYLADAHASEFKRSHKDEHKTATRDACKRAMDYASGADEETLRYIKEALEKIDEVQQAERVESICAINSRLSKAAGESKQDYIERLEQESRSQGWDWAYAQIRIRLAQQYLDDNHSANAQISLEDAIAKLKEEHPLEIREQGLYALLAQAYRLQNKLDKALLYAEYAVKLSPEHPEWRWELGAVYFALNHYGSAESEWKTCLCFNPSSNTLNNIAETYWNRGVILPHPEDRRRAFTRVIEILGHALEIMESESLDSEQSEEQMHSRRRTHYWLSRFHDELMNYGKAISHITIAQAMGFKPLSSKVAMGWTYVKAKAYNEAEQTFRSAAAEAHKQRRKVGSDTKNADAPGEDEPINDLLVQSYLCSAFSYAERGVNLERALRRTRYAKRRIARASGSKRQMYQGGYHDTLGLIHYRAGQINEAIKELEQAVALTADSGAYCRLAQAYLAHVQTDAIGRTHWIAKARDSCIHAGEADLRGAYNKEIGDLIKRLNQLTDPKA